MFKGRGSPVNPANRFEALRYEHTSDDQEPVEEGPNRTQFFRDDTQSIISHNESPDVGFEVSVNPYRGCEHGCAYCYARPTHEYLGFSAGLDFESKIVVKMNAGELLRAALSKPTWQPQTLVLSGVTDCYQPVERKLRLTRSCLEVLEEMRHPAAIVTKNQLVTRDIDLLASLASYQAAGVTLSVTSLDNELAQRLEPRASMPLARLAAIRSLADAGIPVTVNVAPIIPGLNDHEMPAILAAAAEHGATCAYYTLIRLPLAVADVFKAWLATHFPERQALILGRIREIHNGKLNSSDFGDRMHGQGPIAEQIRNLFHTVSRRVGLSQESPELNTRAFRRTRLGQLELGL
jgi:DNA repair photolyase